MLFSIELLIGCDVMAKRKTLGVYLVGDELTRFEAIVEELGVNTHSLMKWAILDFVNRYEAGEAKPKLASQPVLIYPDIEDAPTDES
jgi:hypothetical protein